MTHNSIICDSLRKTIKNVLSDAEPFNITSMESISHIENSISSRSDVQHIWEKLSDIGVPGYSVSLSDGGYDLGESTVVIVCEEMGRVLFGYPFIASITVADMLSQFDGQYNKTLALIAEGKVFSEWVHFSEQECDIEICQSDKRVSSRANAFICNFDQVNFLLIKIGDHIYRVPKDKSGLIVKKNKSIGGTNVYALYLRELILSPDELICNYLPNFDSIKARLRLRQAAYLIGLSSGALATTVKYVNIRKQFGKKLIDHQAISFKLSALYAQLEAVKFKLHSIASMEEREMEILQCATNLLALASELALEISRESLHLHGAYGMTKLSLIDKYYERIAFEGVRYGIPGDLWLESSKLKIKREHVANMKKNEHVKRGYI